MTRLLNWACNTNKLILVHHHHRQERHYKSDRSDIVWRPEERRSLIADAPFRAKRIAIAASAGGLAPQDLGIIRREHVERTPMGRRLHYRRTKTGKPFSIPVTDDMAWVIDTTPADQDHILVSLDGHPLTPLRASAIVRDLKKAANERKPGSIREELRLYDMRGTAATALLRAGCLLNQIAVTMGWGIRHAANVISRYVALVPEESDQVLEKLQAFQERTGGHQVGSSAP